MSAVAALHFDGHPDDWDDVAHSAVEDVPVMADALLRVLDLHSAEGGACAECSGFRPWPCATVRAVTGEESNHD